MPPLCPVAIESAPAASLLIGIFGKLLPARAAAGLRMLVWILVPATVVMLLQQGIKVMGVEGRSKPISLPIELPRSWFCWLPLTLSAASMARPGSIFFC